jgi:hypothetical protein
VRERADGPTLAALGALCLISAATLVALGSRLTFFNDEWYVLLLRPGLSADALLEPHNGHLSLLPVVAYKGLVAAFGLDAQVPFRVLLAATIASAAVAVHLYVRERLGSAVAVICAAVILFLGPAWQDLLWSFQIGLIGSLSTGIVALLALDRPGRRASIVACALLIASLCLSNLGLSFLVAAAIVLVLRRTRSEAWVVAVPALIFAAWWLGWGHEDKTGFAWGNVARTPAYVFDAISSALAASTGLGNYPEGFDAYAWGRPLLALAIVLLAAFLWRGWRPPVTVLPIAAAALSFWALLAANFLPSFREPDTSRYQLISVAFLIMLAADLLRGWRPRQSELLALAGLALVALGSNLVALRDGYHFFKQESEITRADLAALDIGRGHIDRKFRLLQPIAGTVYMTGVYAGPYWRERDAHGSPAFSPAELEAASPQARAAADLVLASGYGLRLFEATAGAGARRDCARLGATPDAGLRERDLPPGGALVANLGGAEATLSLRRFASEGSAELGTLEPGASARLSIPMDHVALPWRLGVSGGTPLLVCPLAIRLRTRAGS